MRAVRLHSPGVEGLVNEPIETPRVRDGEVLVRVHAAGITRDELEWPVERLPAIPSYELSGVVTHVAAGRESLSIGDPVYGLTPFDRDGAAADFVAVAIDVLAPKPKTLDHVEAAALPLSALAAWQGLFDHGRLQEGQRVLVTGATGGVGHLAMQLARWRGAYVIGTASCVGKSADALQAHEVIEATQVREGTVDAFDLIFDTAGGELLECLPALVREGGRLVSVAEQPPEISAEANIEATYFVVAPNRDQLEQIGRLVDSGELRPAIDSVFALEDARAAFERSLARGKRGKVVLRVVDDQ